MSILETFYILFKSDATDVQKGADQAKKSTNNLNDSLAATGDISKKVGSSFVSMGESLAGLVTGFLTVGTVLESIKSAFTQTFNTQQSASLMGVNIQQLDAWGNAVKRNGGSAEAFSSSVKNLATAANIENQSALYLLPKLADVFSKVSNKRAMSFGTSIGLDENTILFLQKGSKEVEKLVRAQYALGTITDKDGKIAKEFNQSWQDATHSFRTASITLEEDFLPTLGKIMIEFGKFAQYIAKNSDYIKGALLGVAVVVAIFASDFLIATGVVLGTIAAFSYGYSKLKDLIHNSGKAIKEASSHIKAPESNWRNFDKLNTVLTKTGALLTWIANLLQKLRSSVNFKIPFTNTKIFDNWKRALTDFDSKPKVIKPLEQKSLSDFDFRNSNAVNRFIPEMTKLHDMFSLANRSPLNSQSSNSIFNSSAKSLNKTTNIQTGPITIETQATDAAGIGDAIGSELQNQFRQATGTHDDGVMI